MDDQLPSTSGIQFSRKRKLSEKDEDWHEEGPEKKVSGNYLDPEETDEEIRSPLLELSDEMLMEIFTRLDSNSIISVSKTCHRLQRITKDKKLWNEVDYTANLLLADELIQHISYLHKDTKTLKIRGVLNLMVMAKLVRQCPILARLEVYDSYIESREISICSFPENLKNLLFKKCEFIKYPEGYITRKFLTRIDKHLTLLESLTIEECSWFDTHDLMALSKILNLKRLNLKGAKNLKESVPYASIAARFGFRKLETLDLRNTPISDADVSCFNITYTLKELYLECPENLRNLPNRSPPPQPQQQPNNDQIDDMPDPDFRDIMVQRLAEIERRAEEIHARRNERYREYMARQQNPDDNRQHENHGMNVIIRNIFDGGEQPNDHPNVHRIHVNWDGENNQILRLGPNPAPQQEPVMIDADANVNVDNVQYQQPPPQVRIQEDGRGVRFEIRQENLRGRNIIRIMNRAQNNNVDEGGLGHEAAEQQPQDEADNGEQPAAQPVPNQPAEEQQQGQNIGDNLRVRVIVQGQNQRVLPHVIIVRGVENNNPFVEVADQRRPGIFINLGREQPITLVSDRAICSYGMSRGNNVVNEGIVFIRCENRRSVTHLEKLFVRYYKLVTDTSLRHLQTAAPQLKLLDVTGTSVTIEGLRSFKLARPGCFIISDYDINAEE